MDIVIKKGLDIPLSEKASTTIEECSVSKAALTFDTFVGPKGIKVLVKVGETVSQGQAIAQDKDGSNRFFVSPVSGKVHEIRRGERRSLQAIVIEKNDSKALSYPPLLPQNVTKETLIQELLNRGLFAHIRQRPFNRLADPYKTPRAIFVKALESAPLGFHPEIQIAKYPEAFQAGLDFLTKLTEGPVHLVHESTTCEAIANASHVQHHSFSGPHPRSLSSLHIHYIDPIRSLNDVIWTLSAWDVLVIGYTLTKGIYFNERLIALGGEGFVESKRCHLQTITGAYIADLIFERLSHPSHGEKRILSGDPLTGKCVSFDDFVRFEDSSLVALIQNQSREFLHFFRPGFNKYTASNSYLSCLSPQSSFSFTTSLHGEPRAFIDGEIYERVMPMRIPTLHLVKAAMADDIESCIELGLLEVAPEDFALATFVCPSKVEMVQLMEEALERFYQQIG